MRTAPACTNWLSRSADPVGGAVRAATTVLSPTHGDRKTAETGILLGVVTTFTILMILVVVASLWFSVYTVYRLYADRS